MNYMASLFFSNPVHAYTASLSFEAFGIICFCHVIEAFEKSYVNTTKSPYTIYFVFLPLFAICSAISTIYYNGEFLRVCSDEHIRMTSIYLENCQAIPNCCREYRGIIEFLSPVFIWSECKPFRWIPYDELGQRHFNWDTGLNFNHYFMLEHHHHDGL